MIDKCCFRAMLLELVRITHKTDFEAMLLRELDDCIKHHQMLLELCKKLEECLSPIILYKTLAACFFLSFMAFSILAVRCP